MKSDVMAHDQKEERSLRKGSWKDLSEGITFDVILAGEQPAREELETTFFDGY